MKRDTAEWLACMVIASAALVYALWAVPYIPTVDGPQHILSAHIENHFADPGSLYPLFYTILPQFAGKGFALIYGPVESLLPWRTALRLTLSLIALAFAWGFALVVLALDARRDDVTRAPPRRPIAMLGFVIALPWSFYMGSFAFIVGSTFGLYTLAFVLRRAPATAGRRAILAALLLVQSVCHVFTAILTGTVVAVVAVATAPKGERLRELGRMALVGLPAIGLLGLTYHYRQIQVSEQRIFEWSLGERFGEISRWFVPGPSLRAWLVIGLMLGGAAAILRRGRAARERPVELALACLTVAFVGLTMFAPLHMPGWQFLAPRFAIVPMVLGLALLPVPQLRSASARRAMLPLVTVCCVGSALTSANLHRKLAEGCADTLAGLDAPLHFEGLRLPFVINPICGTPRHATDGPIPRASLAHNSPLLYLIDHGGIGTKMFRGAPSIHAVGFIADRRPPLPDPRHVDIAQSQWFENDPKIRASLLIDLAADGMPFEGIHVVGGRPSDYRVLNERGYVTEYENSSIFIGRFVGCSSELVLPAEAVGREPVRYEYGLFSKAILTPEPRPIATGVVPPEMPATDGALHIPLRARPCGEIWIRVYWDVDGSGSYTPGDRVCENAHWQGRLRTTVDHDHGSVSCTPSP